MSAETAAMRLGPIQLLVVGFDRPDFSGDVLGELARLRESDVVRVIDLLVIHKDVDGVVQRVQHSDLMADEADDAGDLVGALIGLEEGSAGGPDRAEHDLWSLDGAIPDDSAALIALVEHRWAIGTRLAIRAAGGARRRVDPPGRPGRRRAHQRRRRGVAG